MKNYYTILGVSTSASHAEIKRVYRRLAVQYHPDKNPSPEAITLFQKINEAYDVLGDPVKRRTYDLSFRDPFNILKEESGPVHRDPRYRGRNAGHRPAPSKPSLRHLMKEYLPKVIGFNFAGALLGCLLMIDYFLPVVQTTETVAEMYAVFKTTGRGTQRHYAYDVITTEEGTRIKFYEMKARNFEVGSLIYIEHTPLFSTTRYISNGPETYGVSFAGIYGPVGIVPLALFVISLLGIIFRKNVEWAFNFSIVSGVLLIISLFLVFAI
ncbi:MAG TPA: J domain-containing protein [Ohtaekwangia sp.]|nr:J domain-containing protein [Ohtaekwangia sp.]